MNAFTIHPSKLSGVLTPPPSKSHTHRALLFAMLGQGKSRIENPLLSSDTKAMMRAISLFGAKIDRWGTTLEVEGGFGPCREMIDSENSGQILRFLGAMGALLPTYTFITGDASIRSLRPLSPLLGALEELGAFAKSTLGNGFAPMIVKGPIRPGICHLNGEDSQPVSALLMACSFLDGSTEIVVENPGETPWIDLTLNWLRRLGATVEHRDYRSYFVKGGLSYSGFQYRVPADFSSAAFPIAAALVTQSELTIEGLDPTDCQGDKELIEILRTMGANLHWSDTTLTVFPSALHGISIDLNRCVDALPILAVLGSFASGTTTLYNAAIARKKESDRIRSICQELQKMGATIEEKADGLIVQESSLQGAPLQGHQDHRIALSLIVAALGAQGSSRIEGAQCLSKTYPTFVEDMKHLGATIEPDLVWV
jgi:3-phosphoshikimate 1-carboxyvinyltransferase